MPLNRALPPQENEKWWLCNCTMAICKYNNTVELVEVECEVPPEPTCANGLRPTLVYSPEECCPHWECDCRSPRGAGPLVVG